MIPLRPPVLIVSGVLLWLVGAWGLWKDVELIAQPFYAYAWWGYIFILDGWIAWKCGNSLLTRRRKHVLPMLIWSVTFWYFFELLNLRYQNWYYVGVYKDHTVGFLFSLVCFSTVLIGMFETYEWVTVLSRRSTTDVSYGRFANRPYWKWVSYAMQGIGLIMVTLSLVYPTYLAPLVWGSVSFLLDPWNYRRRARSILRDFEVGDYGLVIRLLAAGLICGAYWESMNFFAPQKWIYTVRGLENLKLFEMPLLGFLGFPALVLDGMAVYSFLSSWFLENETWERPEALHYQVQRWETLPRRYFWISVPLQLLFCWLVVQGVREVNMASERLRLADLPSLDPEARLFLESEGLHRPIRLVREVQNQQRREQLLKLTNLSPDRFQKVLDEALLFSFKGIGTQHGHLLQKAGITQVSEIASQDPAQLHEKLVRIAEEEKKRPPRLDMIRVWIFAARSQGLILRV
jgi:hypothetical protein